MIGIGLGIVRVVAAIGTRVSDLLPVDYSVNLILAAAWSVANVKNGERKSHHLRIFNCVSGPDAPITWGEPQKIKTFNHFNSIIFRERQQLLPTGWTSYITKSQSNLVSRLLLRKIRHRLLHLSISTTHTALLYFRCTSRNQWPQRTTITDLQESG